MTRTKNTCSGPLDNASVGQELVLSTVKGELPSKRHRANKSDVTASAENEQAFSLSRTEWLRTQEKDLSPKYILQQITTKCPMHLWFRYEKTSEFVTTAKKATLEKKEFLKPDTYVKSKTKFQPALSSMTFLLGLIPL